MLPRPMTIRCSLFPVSGENISYLEEYTGAVIAAVCVEKSPGDYRTFTLQSSKRFPMRFKRNYQLHFANVVFRSVISTFIGTCSLCKSQYDCGPSPIAVLDRFEIGRPCIDLRSQYAGKRNRRTVIETLLTLCRGAINQDPEQNCN